MKKLVTIAIMFAAVAILGTALTGAAPDESSASNKASAKSTKPCCQANAVEVSKDVGETGKPECCDQGQTKRTVLAKTESCSGDSCQAGKKAAVGCKLCLGEATVLASPTDALKCKDCPEADCKGECGKLAQACFRSEEGVGSG